MAGCATGPDAATTSEPIPATTTLPPMTTSTVAALTTTTGVSTTTSSSPAATDPRSAFRYEINPVTAEELAHSWHEGCPVGPGDLARIDLIHHDFSGGVKDGALVVHAAMAADVAEVFARMFDAGFPIVSVIPIGELPEGAEDTPNYANTSAFHCRFVEGTERWSEHAMGKAIDINTHLNPYHRGDYIWPEGSDRYLDRSLGEPGMIVEGDAVVRAFDAIGWGWGGRWRSSKDYQHFSASGR